MSWARTRTFYAKKDGKVYNFEAKSQRDRAVTILNMEKCSASEAYKKGLSKCIRVWYHDFEQWLEIARQIWAERR